MFFVLSKTLGIMALRLNFLIGLGGVGSLLLMTLFIRLGRSLLVLSAVLLAGRIDRAKCGPYDRWRSMLIVGRRIAMHFPDHGLPVG